jgi:hypothetical protein
MNEIKSKRYPGLIKQAIKLHAEVEEKGWKLAEVIHEAMTELRNEGFVLFDARDKSRRTASSRIAADMGVGLNTVQAYYTVWKKFSDPSKRDSVLTFSDHTIAAMRPARARAVKARRVAIIENRAGLVGAKRPKAPIVDPMAPYNRLTGAKSFLRKVADSNVWDYPDREKALVYAQEIHQLAGEVLTKFGGQQQVGEIKPARRRPKAA